MVAFLFHTANDQGPAGETDAMADVVAADLSPQFKAFINTILEPDLAARATLRSVKQSDY